jgi:hypothetical protein
LTRGHDDGTEIPGRRDFCLWRHNQIYLDLPACQGFSPTTTEFSGLSGLFSLSVFDKKD